MKLVEAARPEEFVRNHVAEFEHEDESGNIWTIPEDQREVVEECIHSLIAEPEFAFQAMWSCLRQIHSVCKTACIRDPESVIPSIEKLASKGSSWQPTFKDADTAVMRYGRGNLNQIIMNEADLLGRPIKGAELISLLLKDAFEREIPISACFKSPEFAAAMKKGWQQLGREATRTIESDD